MPPKKPRSNRSNSQRKAKNISSLYLITLSAIYIKPRAREKRSFTITKWFRNRIHLRLALFPFSTHLSLATLFLIKGGFSDAQNVPNNKYSLGSAVFLQAVIWYRLGMFKDAASEALHAQGIFEKLGHTVVQLEASRGLLHTR